MRLDAGNDIFILDVREPHEYQICNLGGYLIPLGDLPARMNELDSSREIVAHCRSGVRSAKAVTLLRQAGFGKVKNLAGGILAWSDKQYVILAFGDKTPPPRQLLVRQWRRPEQKPEEGVRTVRGRRDDGLRFPVPEDFRREPSCTNEVRIAPRASLGG